MTKEELEKEAEDFLQKKWGTSKMLILGGDAREVLADFAEPFVEPREKRIAELEDKLANADYQLEGRDLEIKELEKELAISEHDREHNDYELTEVYKKVSELEEENAELKEELKTAYRKGMRHMAKALKDYDRTDGAWTDYFEHTVDKVLQREQLEFEEYGTLADQLTKAKELLERLLITSCNSDVLNLLPNCSEVLRVRVEAEQFLSEVEK